MPDKPGIGAIEKLKRACHDVIDAWWVLFIIAAYTVTAWLFLGSGCVLASTTGLPCPGCGSTRAFFSLLRGDVTESLFYQPLLIPSIVIAFAYIALWLIKDSIPGWMERILITLVILHIVLYAVRMFIYFPDEIPMQYNYKAVIPRLAKLIASCF